jgi:hypothetical protein
LKNPHPNKTIFLKLIGIIKQSKINIVGDFNMRKTATAKDKSLMYSLSFFYKKTVSETYDFLN